MLEVLESPASRLPSLSDDDLLSAYEQGRLEHRRLEARNAALLAEIDRRRESCLQHVPSGCVNIVR